jgi:hypothetical protein
MLDETGKTQIKAVCDQEEFAGSKIRIMPGVHAGVGCTIGTTMTIRDKIVPDREEEIQATVEKLRKQRNPINKLEPKDLAYVEGGQFSLLSFAERYIKNDMDTKLARKNERD